jgi:transcriptional regulator with XRE-family HTH domain
MAVTLDEVMQEFSPEERAEVERQVERMATQSRTLAGLRKMLGVTQGRLADALETSQSNVAQIESKADVMVSTVARVVQALGGRLHLVVTLPGLDPVGLQIGGTPDDPDLERAPLGRSVPEGAARAPGGRTAGAVSDHPAPRTAPAPRPSPRRA